MIAELIVLTTVCFNAQISEIQKNKRKVRLKAVDNTLEKTMHAVGCRVETISSILIAVHHGVSSNPGFEPYLRVF